MDKNKTFDIPIVLFIFKRVDKTQLIIKRISEIRPKKIYIIADGPRDITEAEVVNRCRQMIEESIDWECEIIKNYSQNNRGVYENIGEGAKWVFKKEEQAIFLEDDNLPDLSFFDFCKEMLSEYRSDDRILWICGTNYLEEFENKENTSYVFTQHLLPCGWASWSDKFLKYYDGNLNKLDNDGLQKIKSTYKNRSLFIQQSQLMINEKKRIEKN
ncbi:hypothetical protein [Exiguobacterium sp. AM39-5BH]|uniref:hypothetical protein n=1 Tax=Exiguobacterium sp. AM39-5BH TaxID=2292355 RepID=UPI0018F5178D|nr:hypothetical protein [Exiguobacterium sp. AM39-5BH]